MKEEQPRPYSQEERQEVAELFKKADGFFNHDLMDKIFLDLRSAYGRVNFAYLESICREYNLQTAFLAVPWTEGLRRDNPNTIIVNPNNFQEECLFEAMVCETLADLQYYAQMYGVDDYEPGINLIRLENAGIAIPRPGTENARFSIYYNLN